MSSERIVAVFGASVSRPGDGYYEDGELCGRLLAGAGFGVVTGGYGGLMEAVSKGAAAAGGHVLGVTAPSIFPGRPGGNEFLTEEWRAAHLMERIHELTEVSVAAITLHGSIGTLTELAAAWNLAFVGQRAGQDPKPIVTVGERWAALVPVLAEALETDASLVTVVGTVEEAVAGGRGANADMSGKSIRSKPVADTDFYLGGVIDPETGKRTDELLEYEASDLTTHGVIVGMTGSGKTGLGVIYLEEALRSGIPTLVLDPKGDMTNLLLTFPDLAPSDFRPWVDEAEAKREGKSPDDLAKDTADLWKRGLASWDLDGGDIADLREKAGFTIYTPGSSAGVPLNVIGSLAAPDLDWETEGETIRDEIEGFASGLLGLVGIDTDPLSSREHILLANIIEHAWKNGEDLSLEALLGRIQPPIRKLGVFEVDTFFPEKDRLALAMKLNALAASPAFEEWRAGPPLDPGALLWDEDGRPQAAILYLAHLSDDERQFVVTMALSRLITWMRSQPGSSDLRALVYMDEVFGFVPPTAAPPAKKPILTLMKQARAFGVGMLLSTQNPVDLDYKAMSNAGTWAVGRLQTERDKLRILEALESARGDSDVATLDRLISALDKRQFLLHTTGSDEPAVFTTRWAMSYLRGPLTRDQVADLVGADERRSIKPDEPTAGAPTPDEDATVVAPDVADGITVGHLDPAAPWSDQVGAEAGGTHHTAALAVRVALTFDDRYAEVDHTETWEAVFHPLSGDLDPETAIAVDHDERDFAGEPPGNATYALPDAPIGTKTWFSDAERKIEEHLYRTRKVEVLRNPELKLYSRIGESAEDFSVRCAAVAEEEADKEIAKIRDRFEDKAEDLRERIEAANRKVDAAALEVDTRRQEEMASGAGTLIGVLLGRKSTSSLSTAASKRSMTRKAEQRLETARAKVTDEIEDLEQLEVDLLSEVSDIGTEWAGTAADVETLEIGLEKSDIALEEMTLVWVPVKP